MFFIKGIEVVGGIVIGGIRRKVVGSGVELKGEWQMGS